jgi:hypothetical protein
MKTIIVLAALAAASGAYAAEPAIQIDAWSQYRHGKTETVVTVNNLMVDHTITRLRGTYETRSDLGFTEVGHFSVEYVESGKDRQGRGYTETPYSLLVTNRLLGIDWCEIDGRLMDCAPLVVFTDHPKATR